MQRILITAAIAMLAAAPFVVPAASWAAPQALGLVATNGPVSLKCEDGTCSGEFSTFCLQSERVAPNAGTRYLAYGEGEIRAVARTPDGREISLDPSRDLTLHSARGHYSVRISLSEQAAAISASDVSVTVEQNVALRPEPVAGDTNPQTDQELTIAAGPLRQLGTQYVDNNADRMAAARVANHMINELSREGPYSKTERVAVWNRALDDAGPLSTAARKYARNAFTLCDFILDSGARTSMRGCLEQQHDSLLNILNSGYWKAAGAGS